MIFITSKQLLQNPHHTVLQNMMLKDIRTLYKKLESTIQKVGIVKYDAFQQMGGKLSFCLCMLDEENSGFMLNSVHSTEGCYTYTKEIINGKAMIDLGKEEEAALKMAVGDDD